MFSWDDTFCEAREPNGSRARKKEPLSSPNAVIAASRTTRKPARWAETVSTLPVTPAIAISSRAGANAGQTRIGSMCASRPSSSSRAAR